MTASEFCRHAIAMHRETMATIRADIGAEAIPSEETLRKCRIKASFLLLTVKKMESYISNGFVYAPPIEISKQIARRILNNTKEMVLTIVEMEAAILTEKAKRALEKDKL